MAKYELNNKCVIISGASGGIGRTLTRILTEKYNCRVIGIGRSEEKFAALTAELSMPELFEYRMFDVGVHENWLKFAAELESNGTVPDMLINNAGYLPEFARAEQHSAKTAENIIQTNYLSAVYAFDVLLPILRKSPSPAVVNVSSSAALAPVVGTAVYTASKAALKGYTECLIQDYSGEIYISGVYPGFTRTDIFSHQKTGTTKLIEKVCTPVEKNVGKLIKKLRRRKKRIVLGNDAKAMSFFYRQFPLFTAGAIRYVLKKSKQELFNDVFISQKINDKIIDK